MKNKTSTKQKSSNGIKRYVSGSKTTFLQQAFLEIDLKFSILSEANREWIKTKIMMAMNDAYKRGKEDR